MIIPSIVQTDRMTLRCPTATDAPAINAAILASWPELSAWMDWATGEPPLLSETLARTADRIAGFETRAEFGFGLFVRASGKFVGMASLFEFDWTARTGEVGYWLATSAVGNGFATEAVRALTDLGWQLGLAGLELRCDAKNLSSRAVAERAGFSLVSVLRDDNWNSQKALRDTCIYARDTV